MAKAVQSMKSAKKTKEVVVSKQSCTSNAMALNHVIGKAIAKYRKQAAFSQEQLAEALGIGYEAVSRMERGVVIPTVDRVHLHQLLCSLSHENKQWLMEQIALWVAKLK